MTLAETCSLFLVAVFYFNVMNFLLISLEHFPHFTTLFYPPYPGSWYWMQCETGTLMIWCICCSVKLHLFTNLCLELTVLFWCFMSWTILLLWSAKLVFYCALNDLVKNRFYRLQNCCLLGELATYFDLHLELGLCRRNVITGTLTIWCICCPVNTSLCLELSIYFDAPSIFVHQTFSNSITVVA